jgi:hypothetical protein
MSARRLRGISLLASLFVTLLASLLTALSVLDWWSVPVVLAILVADVAWLRRVAMSERADRAQAQARPAGGAARSVPGRSDAIFDSRYGAQPGSEAQPEHEEEPEPELETVFGTEVAFEPEATQRVEVPEAGSVKATLPIELPVDLDPSGWEPVPVPPPTYTLKAKAEPVIRPNAVTNHEAGQPWSLEGMVYDCELDELVERRSATGA